MDDQQTMRTDARPPAATSTGDRDRGTAATLVRVTMVIINPLGKARMTVAGMTEAIGDVAGDLAGLIGAGEATRAIPSLASRRFSTYSVVFVGNNMPLMWQDARGPDLIPFSGIPPHPGASTC